MIARDIIDTIGNTPLVEIARFSPRPEVRLYAKLEGINPAGSIKDRVAKYMIEKAVESGDLTPDRIILEATSGNTGIALAMIGRRKGFRVTIVMPDNMSVERQQLLRMYGAELVLTNGQLGTNGAIEVARELARDPRYFFTDQFSNPCNVLAHYETTAVEILRDLPQVDVFVSALGTGGTLTGTARRLKEANPNTWAVSVEPPRGQTIQGLRCLDDGFVPSIVDTSLFDERLTVTPDEAFAAARLLLERECIFAGASSGAALHGMLRIAADLPKGNIVTIFPDGGWKYLSMGIWDTTHALGG